MTTKKKPAGKAAKKIEWTRNRGKQPVADGVWVEVRLRNGTTNRGAAGGFDWSIDCKAMVAGDLDIMAWRRVRRPRARKPKDCTSYPSSCPRNEGHGCECTERVFLTDKGMAAAEEAAADTRLALVDGKVAEVPVRHFDRSDELVPVDIVLGNGNTLHMPAARVEPANVDKQPGGCNFMKIPYTEEISHPLADQLDPTTPARPVWDEHRDGDSDGLGCARAMVWSVVAIFAVALLAVILRGCVS